MILNSLVDYYECLLKKGAIAESGWSDVNVSFALEINDKGELMNIISLRHDENGKPVPRKMKVPQQLKRSSGIRPNLLCDNSSYFLGIDNKEKSKRAYDCFKASGNYHKKILGDINNIAVKALINFFETWNPEIADTYSVLNEFREEIIKGGNIVFYYNGEFIHDLCEIKEHIKNTEKTSVDDNIIRCMITGKEGKVAKLHPSIKGIRNAQSSGSSIVSFNAPAFCSYGKEQGLNSPVSEYAANAYGAALNYLIENMSFKQYIGDTATICYSSDGSEIYKGFIDAFFFGEETKYSEKELKNIVENICKGNKVMFNEELLDPNVDFYILGIAPNAARLSIRFFFNNSFGSFINNINQHINRMEIDSFDDSKQKNIPIWRVLKETYREGGNASSELAGELVRAIVMNYKYPSTLINAIDMRIKADRNITYVRAAIIKAYYIKNTNKYVPKEVLTVSLNKETNNAAYNLGRLFAVLEKIQQAANPGINATIRDKFFGSASATPASIFPHLIELSQKHLKKLNSGLKIYYEKEIAEIMDKLESFPKILNMGERGAFQLGYYHQKINKNNNNDGGSDNE